MPPPTVQGKFPQVASDAFGRIVTMYWRSVAGTGRLLWYDNFGWAETQVPTYSFGELPFGFENRGYDCWVIAYRDGSGNVAELKSYNDLADWE